MNPENRASDHAPPDRNALPVGVFDSGVGGLTVLRALRERMPNERFLYLGDTARLPYGTKSAESITRYSLQAAGLLVSQGIKCLVVACNTASATALDALGSRYGSLPVLGVVEPGAEAGCHASVSGRIAVIATESTVQGGAYQREIRRLRSDANVIATACPLFVPLAEEGWTSGLVVEAVAQRYLGPIFERAGSVAPDTLLLGCTHFPVLIDPLRKVVGDDIAIVDSAETTAAALESLLSDRGLQGGAGSGEVRFLATDSRERFARVGAIFLNQPLQPSDIELVDLQEAQSAS